MYIRIKEKQICGVCGNETGFIGTLSGRKEYCTDCRKLYQKYYNQLEFTIKTLRTKFDESIASRIRKHLQTIDKSTDSLLPRKRND